MAGLETLAALSLIAGGVGTAVSAVGTIASGQERAQIGAAEQQRMNAEGVAAYQAADYEAKQYDIQAKEERAAGQRDAEALRRQKKLALSTLQARGAASGFTATDPTTLALADEIEKYGTLQEKMALYGGESRGSSLEATAAGRRFSGRTAYESALMGGNIAAATGDMYRRASTYSAAGTILGGISTMAKYSYGMKRDPRPTSRYDV